MTQTSASQRSSFQVPSLLVATLIAAPGTLSAACVGRIAGALPGAGTPRWLGPATAADIPFAPLPGSDNRRWAERARALLDGVADVVVQPAAGRRKSLLVADMDATLIAEECIDELAAAVGLGPEVAAITERSVRGEVDFTTSLVERVALLRGLPLAELEAVVSRVTPVTGARVLAATMRAHGALTAIASGGFTLFTGPVAARLGFDQHFSNTLEIAEGRLTGAMIPPVFGPQSKRDVLRALRDELGLSAEETMAVGDGANDLPMLREAGLGIAFRAKPMVAAAMPGRIDCGDLTALLYLQGFSSKEFVV